MVGKTEQFIKGLSVVFTKMQSGAGQQRNLYKIMEELRNLFDGMEEGENDGMLR